MGSHLAQEKTVDGILLGAGASVRLGGPKLLISVGGMSVFERVLLSHEASALRSICAVIPGWLPEFRAIAERHGGKRVKFLELAEPGVMSRSLKTGWSWVEENWAPAAVMVSLADKPLVRNRTIDLVVRSWKRAGEGICVPTFEGRWGHPVILDARLGDEVMTVEGDRGALAVLETHRDLVREVVVDSDEVLFDIDSAEDVGELAARLTWNG
jgi:molybdenum cofactor cytidylyltransferase